MDGTGTGPAQPGSQVLACSVSAVQAAIDPVVTFDNKGVTTTGHLTVSTARSLTASGATTTPPYCRIDAVITMPSGVDSVKFEVSMPTPDYNGRYLQEGQGGLPGTGSVSNPRPDLLTSGWATGTTDRGANGTLTTGLCLACGFHVAAVAAERVVHAFYSTSHLVTYASGCSQGGVDPAANARQYGTQDFDGFVSGDTSETVGLVIGYARIAKYVQANGDASWVSPAQLLAAQTAITARYDGNDGAVDGLVQDDRNFRLPDQLLQTVGFTPSQIATMNFINSDWSYNSPAVSPNGMYEGYPISHVTDWTALLGSVPPSQWAANPFLASIAFETVNIYVHDVDPTADETTLSFNQIAQDIIAVQALPYKPYDYRSVRDGGGKMVEYSGFADPFITAFERLQQLDWVHKIAGPGAPLDSWFRYFPIQGMGHCGGSLGPTNPEPSLDIAMVNWVENGQAPSSVTARNPSRTLLLCPEPKAAVYQGSGSVNDANNWSCMPNVTKSVCGPQNWNPLTPCPFDAPGRGVSFTLDRSWTSPNVDPTGTALPARLDGSSAS
jgi:feruloyl esterase